MEKPNTNENFEQMLLHFRQVPDEALTRLQYFQPEIGCFNACSFCSQEAGSAVWQLSAESLKDLTKAISVVAKERKIEIAMGRTEHRQGVLFPYLDNDCFSYPNLDVYLKEVGDKLGTKIRVATVGYSRHNQKLLEMHSRIVKNTPDAFAGIRFSITPYTGGWATRGGGKLSREEYELDMANALQTYMPVMEKLGFGNETTCCELRFEPHIQNAEVFDLFVDGHHIIKSGPHLFVRKISGETELPLSKNLKIEGRDAVYDVAPQDYYYISSDQIIGNGDWRSFAEDLLSGSQEALEKTKLVKVQKFENSDGFYYASDFDFHPDGSFNALHFYPKTEKRNMSGYNNATRFFLNTLLEIKRLYGFGRREKFNDATWENVKEITDRLEAIAEELSSKDIQTSFHLRKNIIPLVLSYFSILQKAKLPASFVFDNKFTIDTGQIVNQGRAKKLFKELVNDNDEPVTPRESRAYGDDVSVSATRGKVWRLVPMPDTELALSPAKSGGKAIINKTLKGSMVLHEVSEHTLRPVDAVTGEPLRKFVIPGISLEHKERSDSWKDFLQPGVIKK